MHPILLAVGAYSLLLSSFTTVLILMRKKFKQWMNTSFYILSISDALYSIFTASIVLMNHIQQITTTDYNDQNTMGINYTLWIQGEKNEEDRLIDLNLTSECDITHEILQYAMLLSPLTNAFVSLLVFSVQCYINVLCLKNQCATFGQCEVNDKGKTYKNNDNINKSELYNSGKCELSVLDTEKKDSRKEGGSKLHSGEDINIVKVGKRSKKWNFLHHFKLHTIESNNRKVTSTFVTGQWILPIFIAGILYCGEYTNRNNIKNREDAKCSIENMFLFDHSYSDNETVNVTHNIKSDLYSTVLYNNHINNITNSSSSNTKKLNEIISRVHSIINSILNDTSNALHESEPTIFYNNSEVLDVTKYVEMHTSTNVLKHNDNLFESSPTENLSNSSLEQGQNDPNVLHSGNNTNEYNINLLLLNNTRKISRKPESLKIDNLNTKIITTTPGVAEYNTFMKPKFHNISAMEENIFSIAENGINKKHGVPKITPHHITNTCSISIQFLRVHLLIFLFLIYFSPILFSLILHINGKLLCQIVLIKITGKYKTLFNSDIDSTKECNNPSNLANATEIDSVRCLQNKTFLSKRNFNEKLGEDVEIIEQVQTHRQRSDQEPNKEYEDYNTLYHMHEHYTALLNQINSTEKLNNFIKILLLCATLLWTPMFLEVLFKVFLCIDAPNWLLNTTYLIAITFSILRNIFNLKIIQLQEIDKNARKANGIYPAT